MANEPSHALLRQLLEDQKADMDNFIEILTKPDNIPIVGMIFILGGATWWGLRQAVNNDRHLANGEPERIIEDMLN